MARIRYAYWYFNASPNRVDDDTAASRTVQLTLEGRFDSPRDVEARGGTADLMKPRQFSATTELGGEARAATGGN
jgi:hypothetical protein